MQDTSLMNVGKWLEIVYITHKISNLDETFSDLNVKYTHLSVANSFIFRIPIFLGTIFTSCQEKDLSHEK